MIFFHSEEWRFNIEVFKIVHQRTNIEGGNARTSKETSGEYGGSPEGTPFPGELDRVEPIRKRTISTVAWTW